MRKITAFIICFLISHNCYAHMGHYKKFNKIEMEILRNGEVIGYNFYFFKNNNLTKNKPINFKKSDFLKKCTEPIYNFKSEKKSNYKCTVSNEKLFCGHQ